MSGRVQRTGVLAAACLAAWLGGARVGSAQATESGTNAPAPAAPSAADPDTLFLQAKAAYDADRLTTASERYRRIESEGYAAPQLDYNLGNVLFRQGDLAGAVLRYRRAWYRLPRDPDVRANLAFALRTAGAPEPRAPLWRRLLLKLSRGEWRAAAAGTYAATAALLCAFILWRRARPVLGRLAAVGGVGVAVGLAGLFAWHGLAARPEAVVRADGARARFAPIADATVHFAAPVGTILRLVGTEGDWYKVTLNGQTGWLPTNAVVRVAPAGEKP